VIALTKLSICLQLIRIFAINMERGARFWAMQSFIWINMLYFMACFWVSLFQCRPIDKLWNTWKDGWCLNYGAYILATGIFNCASDFWLLVFPLANIWGLQMSARQKSGISAVFLVGTL
jgi:hypothetical protein